VKKQLEQEPPLFSKAIARTPCRNLVNGLTTAHLGAPDYEKALAQHREYIRALRTCGLEVIVLEADDNYPDSTFVEDTALLTPRCAVITRPGAPSRRGEVDAVRDALREHYANIQSIREPGTLEAGDVMMVGDHCYIGLSRRTNEAGARQLIEILETCGMTGSTVTLKNVLHLKSGVAYLKNNNLLATGEFPSKPEFQRFNILKIHLDESYAANCVWINGSVLVPKGFPKASATIQEAGYDTIEVDVSEFQKLDGGLSCLSLRF